MNIFIINFVVLVAQSMEYAAFMHYNDLVRMGMKHEKAQKAQRQALAALQTGNRIVINALAVDLAEYMCDAHHNTLKRVRIA